MNESAVGNLLTHEEFAWEIIILKLVIANASCANKIDALARLHVLRSR